MAATRSSNKSVPKKSTAAQTRAINKEREEKQAAVKREVILITTLAIAILLFLCNFGIIGTVGNVISGILFGLFGLLAYIVPIFMLILVAFGLSNQGNLFAVKKIIAAIILFILLGIALELMSGTMVTLEIMLEGENGFSDSIKSIYTTSSEEKVGGGIVAGVLALLLHHYIAMAGAMFSILVLGIICIVILTEKSFIRGVQNSSKIVYESAKEESVKRKEKNIHRREENLQRQEDKQLRMDNKVSGVMMDTTLSKEDDFRGTDEIHEIHIQEMKESETAEKLEFNEKLSLKEKQPIKEIESIKNKHGIKEISPSSADDMSYDSMDHIRIKGAFEQKEVSSSIEDKTINMNGSNHYLIDPKPINHKIKIVDRPTASFGNAQESMQTQLSIQAEVKAPSAINRKQYKFPPIELLKKVENKGAGDTERQLKETAHQLQKTLLTFGVKVTVTDISQGPSVTRFELQPEQGVKVSKIVGLADDIKLNLAAVDIRIEAPIPGKAAVGIEIPNKENTTVSLRELFETENFKEFDSNIAFAVGKDIGGNTIVSDIGKMPHMLIAGATGSGKSVCINTLIMSILYKAHPDDVKMIMIDPKVVELSVYNGIPHLLIPVVTDPKKASAALHWGVAEMTERYQKFADYNVRDLKGYNKKVEKLKVDAEGVPLVKMPQVIIIVDELADLMMVAPGEVESSICRLAQLARAAGIHLIIATQRPSVDVITGLIKANMPSRVAFSVSSGIDSRTILDMNGAEKLLGRGDMLFYPQGYPKPVRIQGAFVSDNEVGDVVDFLKNQAIGNVYDENINDKIENLKSTGNTSGNGTSVNNADERDVHFLEAGQFIIEKDKASIGMLQRVFKIGFNRAARIMDQLAEAGVVSEEEGTKARKVLMTMEEFDIYIEEYL